MSTTTRRYAADLRILTVNDVYTATAVDGVGGWAQLGTLLRAYRTPNTLVCVNGDFLGGSSLGEYFKGATIIDVLNALDVDLVVIGNHEFDFGNAVLKERILDSRFAWLASNITERGQTGQFGACLETLQMHLEMDDATAGDATASPATTPTVPGAPAASAPCAGRLRWAWREAGHKQRTWREHGVGSSSTASTDQSMASNASATATAAAGGVPFHSTPPDHTTQHNHPHTRTHDHLEVPHHRIVDCTDAKATVSPLAPHHIKLGFVGLCTQATPSLSFPDPSAQFASPLDTMTRLKPALSDVDYLVTITHLSYSEDLELSEQHKQIQLILGGHDHDPLISLQHNCLLFKAGMNANWLGCIDVHFEMEIDTAAALSASTSSNSLSSSLAYPSISPTFAPLPPPSLAAGPTPLAMSLSTSDASSSSLLAVPPRTSAAAALNLLHHDVTDAANHSSSTSSSSASPPSLPSPPPTASSPGASVPSPVLSPIRSPARSPGLGYAATPMLRRRLRSFPSWSLISNHHVPVDSAVTDVLTRYLERMDRELNSDGGAEVLCTVGERVTSVLTSSSDPDTLAAFEWSTLLPVLPSASLSADPATNSSSAGIPASLTTTTTTASDLPHGYDWSTMFPPVRAELFISSDSAAPVVTTRSTHVRRSGSPFADLIADALAFHYGDLGCTIGMINGGFIRADRSYACGHELSVREIKAELPFPKVAVCLRITGEALIDGINEMLRFWPAPAGCFPHVSSRVRLIFDARSDANAAPTDDSSAAASDGVAAGAAEAEAADASASAATTPSHLPPLTPLRRVLAMTLDGRPLGPRTTYTVAMTNFMASGGDGVRSFQDRGRIISKDALRVSDIVIKALRRIRTLEPIDEHRVRGVIALPASDGK